MQDSLDEVHKSILSWDVVQVEDVIAVGNAKRRMRCKAHQNIICAPGIRRRKNERENNINQEKHEEEPRKWNSNFNKCR